MSSKRKSTDENEAEDCKKSKPNTHWASGLIALIEDPELHVKSDETVVVIKDKYPKAEFHYLILPKEDISSLKVVNEKHVGLLRHMHSVGEKLAADPEHKSRTFKIGYHSEPSLFRLHLHVISDDMNSPCLKTKKHWNSFTTQFFLDSENLCDSLESEGKVKLLSPDVCKELLDTPLKCHKCDFVPKNMPHLKKHILTHTK